MRSFALTAVAALTVLHVACTDDSGLDITGAASGSGAPGSSSGGGTPVPAPGTPPGSGSTTPGGGGSTPPGGGSGGGGPGGVPGVPPSPGGGLDAGAGTGGGGTSPPADAGTAVDTARRPDASPATCPPVCATACQFGNVTDANGCPTCQCKPAPPPPPPTCSPVTCRLLCPNGFARDASGCAICQCAPPTCALAECGPAPGAPSVKCADGSVAGPVCERGPNGVCSWRITTCPPAPCAAEACANQARPSIAILCAAGTRPTDVCQPNTSGVCVWRPTCATMSCSQITVRTTCDADAECRWLEPGCGAPKLPAPGCYARARIGCDTNAMCPAGSQCMKVAVNPCPASSTPGTVACAACAHITTLCF